MSAAQGLAAGQAEYDVEVGPHPQGDLFVLALEADEEISSLFSVELTVAPREGVVVDPASLLGQPATVDVHAGDGERYFHGMVAEVRAWDGGRKDESVRLRLRIVPDLWRLGQGRRSRIYQDLSVPDIVADVLKRGGVAFDPRLTGSYGKREYCVQYDESDLDFVARLLEEEGIFFFFDHDATSHTLVLSDASGACLPLDGDPVLPFRERSRMVAGKEFVEAFSARMAIRPGKVTLRDYQWKKPALDLTASEAGSADATLEVYDYPAGHGDEAGGKRLAKLRLEAERAGVQTMAGAGVARRMATGRVFTLEGHPVDALDQDYLVVSVTHRGAQAHPLAEGGPGAHERTFGNEFRCIPLQVPYRPPRRTRRPFIAGPQTAIVTGPGGEEIHTEEHARIKVQFHWDREGQRDERSSCWIRVAQAWAGPGWGALYLPRIGQEVVVEFLEGDPDRPIVTGSVYNGANPPPISLPTEKTKSTLRSATTPGSGGSNELRFEDAQGREEIFLHAQRDLNVVVENDKTQHVGGFERLTVEKDRSRQVHGNQALDVTGNDSSTIGGNQSLTVGASRTTAVGANHAETVGGSQSISVGGAQTVTVALASAETVGLAKALTVGGAYAVTVGGAMNELVGGLKAEEVGGAKLERVGGKKTETVNGPRSLLVGGELTETVGSDRNLTVGKDLSVSVGGKLKQTVTDEYKLQAKVITFSADDELAIVVGGATLVLKKSGDVVLKGKEIKLTASGDIVLKAAKIAEN